MHKISAFIILSRVSAFTRLQLCFARNTFRWLFTGGRDRREKAFNKSPLFKLIKFSRHRLEEGGALTISRLDPATDSGNYTCTVTSRDGESARRNIRIIIHSPPVLEPFSFPTSLQEGGRAQVTCYVTSGDLPIHFTWYKDSEPISASLQVDTEKSTRLFTLFRAVRLSGWYCPRHWNSRLSRSLVFP